MPRKAKNSPATPERKPGRFELDPKADWGGFINIKVTDEEKDTFETWWGVHRTDIWSSLEDLLGEGMKVALAYDALNECWTCSLTGKGWAASQLRWCMSSRAGTLDESIALALWKHFVLADGDWGDFLPKTGRKQQWG